ncbi:hypothetical protein FEM48_Zijuj02G0202700 [Ziziphus jujuba var. spinosa]|uniref:GATA-type domain-containing protein n=1 Tax=Ziziphus jujuba var. spinosa TaxID=714518 RepID=A0A978VXS1_ZIZJJ|nr:hypothetical protein FEM48_Zijuj02G0202700 [Ziziphus jujuba var. spinosa]
MTDDHHHRSRSGESKQELDLTLRLGLPYDVSDRKSLNPIDSILINSVFISPQDRYPINLNSNVSLTHQPALAMDWCGKVLGVGGHHNVCSEPRRGINNTVQNSYWTLAMRSQTHLKLNSSNGLVGDYTKSYKNAFPPPPKMNVDYILLNPSARRSHRRPGGSMRRRSMRHQRHQVVEDPNKRCTNYNCATRTTPMWRKGPLGPKTLCNACGIKYRKQEEKRKEKEEAKQAAKEAAEKAVAARAANI